MVDKLKLVSIQTLKATKVAVKRADRKLKMADPLMKERIIIIKKRNGQTVACACF